MFQITLFTAVHCDVLNAIYEQFFIPSYTFLIIWCTPSLTGLGKQYVSGNHSWIDGYLFSIARGINIVVTLKLQLLHFVLHAISSTVLSDSFMPFKRYSSRSEGAVWRSVLHVWFVMWRSWVRAPSKPPPPLFPWARNFTHIVLYWLVPGTDLSVISQSN